jgi:hypothetical protein
MQVLGQIALQCWRNLPYHSYRVILKGGWSFHFVQVKRAFQRVYQREVGGVATVTLTVASDDTYFIGR